MNATGLLTKKDIDSMIAHMWDCGDDAIPHYLPRLLQDYRTLLQTVADLKRQLAELEVVR